MFYEETTKLGRISYDISLLSSIVSHAASFASPGHAFPSDGKGRLIKQQKNETSLKYNDDFLEAELNDNKLDIRCHVVLRFGAGLNKTLELLDMEIRRQVTETAGNEVGELMIIVKGVLSKNLARRNLLYHSHADGTHEIYWDYI